MLSLRTRSLNAACLLTLLGASIELGVSRCHAQAKDPPYSDPRTAQNPNDKGPPSDDPNEPDVGKRPRFLWKLGRQRLQPFNSAIRALDAIPGYARSNDRSIPNDRKQAILESAKELLAPKLYPEDGTSVRWYGMWTSSLRHDAEGRFVAKEPEKLSWVLAQWDVGAYQIRTGRGLRVRFPKRADLRFLPRPPDFKGRYDEWDFVSVEGLRKVLGEFFAIPFEQYDGFRVRGDIKTLAGVDVFVGTFWFRSGPQDSANGSPSWKGPHRILITDSDPQYVCVVFKFDDK